MNEKNIGYSPETVKKVDSLARMPKRRNAEQYDVINEGTFLLNQSDQILANASDEAFEKYVNKMTSRNIKATNISTDL